MHLNILSVMFDSLSEKLERAFKMLKGQGKITEINVSETLKEIRRALIDADVNYKIAKEFTERVKEKALGQKCAYGCFSGPVNGKDYPRRAY